MTSRRREFIVGLFSLIGVVALLILTIQIKGTSLFERKYTVKVRFPQVAGSLTRGASVFVYGVKVGEATDIRLEPDEKFPDAPVVLELRISEKMQLYENAEVIIQESAIIGETTVVVGPGTPKAPELVDGMTIRGVDRGDVFNEITRRAPEIMLEIAESVRIINEFLNTLNENQQVSQAVADLVSIIGHVEESITTGEGDWRTLVSNLVEFTDHMNDSLVLFDETVVAARDDIQGLREEIGDAIDTFHLYSQESFVQASEVLEHLDGTVELLDDYSTRNAERWSAITADIASTSRSVANLLARVDSGEGSVGLLMTDEALYHEFTGALAALSEWLTEVDAWLAGAEQPLEERVVPYDRSIRPAPSGASTP
jgi:phospholipid/cholesterol/gamma-HCH transport system substrate-binding protein